MESHITEVNSDAWVWIEFLAKFNGQCYIPEHFWSTNEALKLFTDSSGNASLGCSAFYQCHCVQLQWPNHWKGSDILGDITFLELVSIVLSFFIWGEEFKNKILLRVDNQALVSIVNKRTSKSKRVMMLIRKLVFLTMYNNVQFKASHIQGVHNKIADALSRFQDQRFRTLTPGTDLLPAVIPQEFVMIISDLK